METQPHWINEILDEDTTFVLKNPRRQKTNKENKQEEQDDVANLQPVEMRSWLYGCKVPSCNLTVLSVTFTDTTWHTNTQNMFLYTSKGTRHFLLHDLICSHLLPGPHLDSMLLIKVIWAQDNVTAVHTQSLKKKVEKPFHKTQADVQVCSLLFILTYFTPCWVWACQMGTDYLWSPWWFDPRSCSAAAFRHKPGRQGLKVTCWQSTIH